MSMQAKAQASAIRSLWGKEFANKVLEEAEARSPEPRWESIVATAIKHLVEENKELRARIESLEPPNPMEE